MSINPQMIAVMREVRGLSQQQLAEAIGVAQPMIHYMESGEREVPAARAEQLAEALDCPVPLLEQTEPLRAGEAGDLHFRRRKSLLVRDRRKIEYQLHLAYLTVRGLLRGVDFDAPLPLPDIQVEEPGDAAEAARTLRRLWRVPSGPVASMSRYLEGAGVFLVPCDVSGKVDAVTRRGDDGWHVIAYNKAFPDDRLRHTKAHELGHLVLHRLSGREEVEHEADDFAAEFLLPEAEIRPLLTGLTTRDMSRLMDLRTTWGVSVKSLVFRAQRLGCISERQARSFYAMLNSQAALSTGTSPLPHDEQPRLLEQVVAMHRTTMRRSAAETAQAALMTEARYRFRFEPRTGLRVV